MANICAVVLNTVSRDARVLKEAASLQQAGHQVTIIGLMDKHVTQAEEILPNGVVIHRIPIMRAQYVLRSFVRFILFTAVALLAYPIVISKIFHIISASLILGYVFIVAAFSFYQLLRQFIAFQKIDDVSDTTASPIRIISFRYQWNRTTQPLYRFIAQTNKAIMRRLRGLVRTWYMVHKVKSVCCDVVHCHDVHTLPIGLRLKRHTGCKLIYDAHEIYEEVAQASLLDRRYCKTLHRRVQKHLDGFITINESIAKWYAEHYPAFPKATIIMNATHNIDAPVDDGRLHKAARLGNDTQILLYQGGYSTHRGLPYLLEAAAYLPQNWSLVMMGWGNYEEHLREIAARVNQHREVIRFIPPAPQSDLAAWTAGATIGIIPYENTGLNHWFCTPNKLWEYPNAGVPVLVSPFPELRRPVEHYGYGWVLPETQDPKALAELIAALRPEEIAQAKANCAKFLAENHWGIYAERLTDAYKQWLGAR